MTKLLVRIVFIYCAVVVFAVACATAGFEITAIQEPMARIAEALTQH